MSSYTLNPSAVIASSPGNVVVTVESVAISADIKAIQAWRQRWIEFAKISEYKTNWDGYDSEAPSMSAISAAAQFLRSYQQLGPDKPPVRIALSPDGLFTAYWMSGNVLLRAEVQDSYEVEWMVAITGKETEFFTTKLENVPDPRSEQEQNWTSTPITEGGLALASAR